MSEPRVLTYSQMRDAAQALYVARRHAIELARAAHGWRDKRPPEWFFEQIGRLEEIAQIGVELAFIARHQAAYETWKAGR
jgi:hypothetical protein